MPVTHLTKEQLDNFANEWRGTSKHRALWTSAERASRALTAYEDALCDFYENTSGARLSGEDFSAAFREPRIPDDEAGHPRYHQTHHLKIEQLYNELFLFCEWCQVKIWEDKLGEQETHDDLADFEGDIYCDIARELRKRGYECDLEHTGGNIYLLVLGQWDGAQIWIDDCGNVVYHPDPEDSGVYEILFDGTEANPYSYEWNVHVQRVAELVEKEIQRGRITVKRRQG
jgi:hypothetical protein